MVGPCGWAVLMGWMLIHSALWRCPSGPSLGLWTFTSRFCVDGSFSLSLGNCLRVPLLCHTAPAHWVSRHCKSVFLPGWLHPSCQPGRVLWHISFRQHLVFSAVLIFQQVWEMAQPLHLLPLLARYQVLPCRLPGGMPHHELVAPQVNCRFYSLHMFQALLHDWHVAWKYFLSLCSLLFSILLKGLYTEQYFLFWYRPKFITFLFMDCTFNYYFFENWALHFLFNCGSVVYVQDLSVFFGWICWNHLLPMHLTFILQCCFLMYRNFYIQLS